MTSSDLDGYRVGGCTCDQCGGEGTEVVDYLDYFTGVEVTDTIPCERCAGTGHLCGNPEWQEVEPEPDESPTCSRCGDTGWVRGWVWQDWETGQEVIEPIPCDLCAAGERVGLDGWAE